LRVGTITRLGDRLGAIIPQGELKAVAYFPPDIALGRIRTGQSAQMRLQGFPWTQYGSVALFVANISNEARDGRIRVEFKLNQSVKTLIPLEHGLPGAVEVEVDRLSPAMLVLSTIGKRMETPAVASSANRRESAAP
jgi:membrane fusion protein (multidrug efflux system)